MGASARAYTAFGKEIQQFLESEAKNLSDVTDRRYAYNQALQAGILTQKQYGAAMQDLVKQEAALGGAMGSTANAHGRLSSAAGMSSFQLMELGRIMKDIATGQTALLERSTLTLAASTGVLGNAISALLGVWGLVAAAVVAVIAAFASAESEQSKFNHALIETGNFAGTTVAGLEAMKDQIGSSRGEYSAAATALTELAASGKFSGDQLRLAA